METPVYTDKLLAALVLVASYLVGSIPWGWLVGRAKGVDIRKVGSGNIGATNVGRLLGRPYGLLVFALDFLKGFLPVLFAKWSYAEQPVGFPETDMPVLGALAALLGHIYPVWLGFRASGKGGATGLGVASVLAPWPTLIALVTWGLVVAVARYVSLGTILGALAFAAGYYLLVGEPFARANLAMSLFTLFAVLLVVVRHRSNIARLWSGTEHRVGDRREAGATG